jgi:hypothetical protein
VHAIPQLTQNIGDTVTHRIPLRWKGRPFTHTAGWTFLFTVKRNKGDEDSAAAFQKTHPSGGISLSGGHATVQVLPQDTLSQSEGTLVWDIQATSDLGESLSVAEGTLVLKRDVTRLSEPSMPVHTVAPPLLFFSYQSYLESTTDNPPLTEEQWVGRLGSSNPQVVSIAPPLDPLPYEGLEWFDPSDGSTSVWMWLGEAQESVADGVFVSQFPTPADTGAPVGAITDDEGNVFLDVEGNYLVLT